jgi:hypothetical protein
VAAAAGAGGSARVVEEGETSLLVAAGVGFDGFVFSVEVAATSAAVHVC